MPFILLGSRCAATLHSRHHPALSEGEPLNSMPYEAAVQMEEDLAEDLRRAGYTLTGGH
jgi:hypothetical protein